MREINHTSTNQIRPQLLDEAAPGGQVVPEECTDVGLDTEGSRLLPLQTVDDVFSV